MNFRSRKKDSMKQGQSDKENNWSKDLWANIAAFMFALFSLVLLINMRLLCKSSESCNVFIEIVVTSALVSIFRDRVDRIWRSLPFTFYAHFYFTQLANCIAAGKYGLFIMNLSSIFVVAFICCETIKMHLSRHAPGHEHQ